MIKYRAITNLLNNLKNLELWFFSRQECETGTNDTVHSQVILKCFCGP
jgi:hypothetical protein